ncbi:Uncharacterised protein [Mycobacteroides abscessus subsp. abscessus]|nr:Uncharacterised protein [Mycobacteroides abscessus subsp. abscessus]
MPCQFVTSSNPARPTAACMKGPLHTSDAHAAGAVLSRGYFARIACTALTLRPSRSATSVADNERSNPTVNSSSDHSRAIKLHTNCSIHAGV